MTLTGCFERLQLLDLETTGGVFLLFFFFFLPHSPHVVRWDSHLGNSMPVLLSREWQWRDTKALRDSWIFSILSCRERSLTAETSFVKMALKAHNYGKCHIQPRRWLENVSLVCDPVPPSSFYSSRTATTQFFFTLPCVIALLANSPTSAPFTSASIAGAKDLYAYFYSC